MLLHLSLTQFRNIPFAELSPAKRINLILGENGSGKTSLLEAIYLLAMGRSFRSRALKHAVRLEQSQLTLFTRTTENQPIGLQFNHQTGLQMRLNNAPLKKLSDLVAQVPLQFIPANCHQYFELGPRFRRKMVDWGVFHVEHRFNFHWQSYKKVLQQRNAAIKQHKPDNEITVWDDYLVSHGSAITSLREAYLKQLFVYFEPLFYQLCPELTQLDFCLRYVQGWNKDSNYADYLKQHLARDRALGYTRSGPHAGDWTLKVNGADPYEMLSRGQQKLFFIALSLAQIQFLAEKKNIKNSILLIDDLSSELDWHHQITTIETIKNLPVQAFITSTHEPLETLVDSANDKVFHVKQGEFSAK